MSDKLRARIETLKAELQAEVARDGDWHLTRVYLPTGAVAHQLTFVLDSVSNGYPPCIRCSRRPRWGSCWYGTGSMAEQERAAALPLCSTRGHVWGGAE